MSFLTILFLALGVAADAFACAIAEGTTLRKNALKRLTVMAAVFAIFQAVMPAIGWALGYVFAEISFIQAIDHWIAFVLLGAVGLKMVRDALTGGEDPAAQEDDGTIQLKSTLILGFATSIDALAVGLGLAFVEANILVVALAMGVATFVLSLIGAWIGHHGGGRFGKWATLAGGVILILLGLNMVIEGVTS